MGNWLGRKKLRVEEEFTRPQGIHQQPYNVDYKKLRRLIRSGKLAPCFPGQDEGSPDLEECPICFYYFPSLNRSRCCTKSICTECFLQMKPQDIMRSALCPFCKSVCYAVEYRGARTQEEKGLEIAEEQKVIEAQLRMQYEESQLQKSQPQAPISSQMELSVDEVRSLPDPPAVTLAVTTETVLSDHESREIGSHEEAMMLVQAIWLSVQVLVESMTTADGGLCSDAGSWESVQIPNQAVQCGDIPVCEQTFHGNAVHEASEPRDDEASSRNISDSEQCSRYPTLCNDSSLNNDQSMGSWYLHSASISDASSSSSSYEDHHCVNCHNESNHLSAFSKWQ